MSETSPPRRWARFLPIFIIGALFAGVIASGELRRLSLGDLSANGPALIAFVMRHPRASLALYLGLYVLIVVACVPGPSVMSIAGGFLFGPLIGGLAGLASCVVGAVIVFLACRTAFGDWAARRAGPTIARIEAGFSRDAFAYLLALRLMPIAPFFLVNLAAGLARVRLSRFALATLIGTAPASFVFAGLGAGLGRLMGHKLDASALLRPEVLAPLTGLAILSLAAPAWRLWRSRRRPG
jgi:uncharacterized membrane protein YdjX (TVP38/TMEM64 family)